MADKVSSFDVLNKMCDGDAEGKVLRMFAGNNLIEAKTGKNGWGFAKIAINNETVNNMGFDNWNIALLVYDPKAFKATKAELETGNGAQE